MSLQAPSFANLADSGSIESFDERRPHGFATSPVDQARGVEDRPRWRRDGGGASRGGEPHDEMQRTFGAFGVHEDPNALFEGRLDVPAGPPRGSRSGRPAPGFGRPAAPPDWDVGPRGLPPQRGGP